MTETKAAPAYLFNPAYRPGVEPLRTPLRGDASRGILWNQAVKLVPEPTATDLVDYGGCHRCATVAEVADHHGLPEDQVEALLRSPKVTTATYQPPRADGDETDPDPISLIVLDHPTRTRLRQAVKEAQKAEPADPPKARKTKPTPKTQADTPATDGGE